MGSVRSRIAGFVEVALDVDGLTCTVVVDAQALTAVEATGWVLSCELDGGDCSMNEELRAELVALAWEECRSRHMGERAW